jgi:hypothetical protein
MSRQSTGIPWTYDHNVGGPLDFDKTVYTRLMFNSHELINKFEIPIRSGWFWLATCNIHNVLIFFAKISCYY